MSDISQFIGEDSRKPIERLRRYQLWKIADHFKLQYPTGASKQAMIQLFQANNIDPTRCPDVQWMSVNGMNSNGQPTQEIYPVVPEHASMRNGVNADFVVSERISKQAEEEQKFQDAQIAALRKENETLKRDNAELKETLDTRLAALEKRAPIIDTKPPKRPSPYWDAYHKAMELNLPVKRGMKLRQIQALLDKAETGG